MYLKCMKREQTSDPGPFTSPAKPPQMESSTPDRDAVLGHTIQISPIGVVEIKDPFPRIRVFPPYVDGLVGLDQWSHLVVLWWFHHHDTPEQRRILQVHPLGNPQHPLTGVFATRAPMRPNLIALTVCRIQQVEPPFVYVHRIDARDQSPVLDLKPLVPSDLAPSDVRVPDWMPRQWLHSAE